MLVPLRPLTSVRSRALDVAREARAAADALGAVFARLLLITALRQPRPRWPGRPFGPAETTSPLEQRLRPIARRLRLRRTFEHLPLALLQLASSLLIGALLMRLFDELAFFWLGLALGLLMAGASTWQVAGRPIGPFEAARHADTALRLRERLATALELLDQGHTDDAGASNPLVARQIADATAAAARLQPRAAVPLWPAAGEALRRLLRRCGMAGLLLAGAALLTLTPGGVNPLAPQSLQDRRLAMAEPGRQEQELAQPPGTATGDVQSVGALSQRPNEVGQPAEGLLTSPQQNSPPQAGGDQAGQATDPSAQQLQQDVSSQQDASIAQRQQAVQDLGNALRQSQVAKQAGESLRQGDTQRGSQQLAQVADQVSRLSPGERQTLSQALSQAAQQIGSKDQRLANQAKQAADALSQYRNRDAQQAIRDMANQVRDTGQQAQAQRELQQRAAQLQRGGQAQLPQAGQNSAAQQSQQGQPSQQSGQSQQPRDGGTASGGQDQGQQGDLAQLESGLQSGGLAGNSGSTGWGTGSSAGIQGPPQRLNVEGHPVEVQAEVGEGPTLWRPPSPNAPPVAALPPAPAASSGPASSAPVGAGPDVNSVPRDLAGSVRQYFTPPDQPANP